MGAHMRERTHDIMQTITSTPATLAADLDTAAPLDPSRPIVIVAGDVRQTLAAGWSPEDIGGAMQAAYDAAGVAPRAFHVIDRICDDLTISALDTPAPIVISAATVAAMPALPVLQPDAVLPADRDVARAMAHGSRGFSAEADARIAAQERLADDLGFRLPPPIYRRGMLLRSDGAERVEAMRRQWERMHTVPQAVARFCSVVAAEQRKDVDVDIGALRFSADGSIIYTPTDAAALQCEADGWPSLANRLAAVADVPQIGASLAQYAGPLAHLRGDYLHALRTEINRAHAVDCNEARKADRKPPAAPALRLRTRVTSTGGGRQVYAVTSTRYRALDVDRVAEIVAEVTAAQGGEYRCDISYDRRRARIQVVTFTDVAGVDAAAGEVFKAGFSVLADDVGDGGIAAEAEVWRNLCLNFIVIKSSRVRVESIQHRGEIDDLAAKVRKAVDAALAKIAPFAGMWNRAQARPLAADVDVRAAAGDPLADAIAAWQRQAEADRAAAHLAWGHDLMAGVFRGLAREHALVPARSIETEIPRLLAAHDDPRNAGRAREHGPTRASVVNALTLYAQAHDPAREVLIERAAGTILATPSPLPYALAE